MIPNNSMPINNELLTEVFAKGLLSQREMRIAFFIIRWSWGFDKGEKRQQWTMKMTIRKISEGTLIDEWNCSRTLKKIISENKIFKRDGCYAFNENYNEWKICSFGRMASGTPAKKATFVCQNSMNNLPNRQHQEVKNAGGIASASPPKEKIKENKKKIIFNEKNFKLENIGEGRIKKWEEAFPYIDVKSELLKMEVWLAANPKKRKKNYERFIINWLVRAKGGIYADRSKFVAISSQRSAEGAPFEAGAGEW